MSNSWENQVVVVTGNLGSGKSSVTRVLKDLGAFVVSADDLARRSVERNSPGFHQVVAEFGSAILDQNGDLDRKKLGACVFSDPSARRRLENIIHPIVAVLAEKKFQSAAAANASVLVYECPLFFEAKLNTRNFKHVVVVQASRETSIQRVMKRDGLTREEVEQRYDTQLPNSTKCADANTIINTEASEGEVRAKVEALFQTLQGQPAPGR